MTGCIMTYMLGLSRVHIDFSGFLFGSTIVPDSPSAKEFSPYWRDVLWRERASHGPNAFTVFVANQSLDYSYAMPQLCSWQENLCLF